MERTRKICSGYIITNKINKKQYVGITSHSVKHRWKIHQTDAKFTNSKYKNHLHNAINKYGAENFTIQTIKKSKDWPALCQWEIRTIKNLNTKNPTIGYNLTDGGEGAPGIKRTEHFKRKLSKTKTKFYENPQNRKDQKERSKKIWEDPKTREQQSKRSKKLWTDSRYRERTIKGLTDKVYNNTELQKRRKQAIRKATCENPEWLKTQREKNKKLAEDPEWRNKVSEGLKNAYENNPEYKLNRKKQTQNYWDEGHEKRRKEHAMVMSKMIQEKLKDPNYQKWRNENPPNGKPILYQNKYFRSINEACRFFRTNNPKINRDIDRKIPGCAKLDPTGIYVFEVQYK